MYIKKIETGKSYKKLIIAFIVVGLILIGFVVYNSFSRAEIIVSPRKETLKVDFDTEISEGQGLNREQLGSIKGKILTTTLEENQKITDIPEGLIPAKAKGKVIMYNKMGKSQGIKVRTQLQSEKTGLIFRTDKHVNLPAHGQVEVPVIADKPGKEGNIGPDHFRVIKLSPAWQELIYAESTEPMTGGEIEGKVATQEVIDKAKEKVLNDIYQKSKKSWQAKLAKNEKILDDAVVKEIISSKVSVEPDTPAEEFEVYMKARIVAVVFDENILLNLAKAKVKSRVVGSKEYQTHRPESFRYRVKDYDLQKKKATISCHLEGIAVAKLDDKLFNKEKLVGRNKEEVKAYFLNNRQVESVKVHFSPFWTKSVPSLLDHIEIKVSK